MSSRRAPSIRQGNVDYGSTTLELLGNELRRHSLITVHVAIDRRANDGFVRRILFDSDPAGEPRSRRWRYGVLDLISGQISGRVAARWLRPSSKSAVLAGVRFALPPFLPNVQWRWNPSHSSWGDVVVPRPHVAYELGWPADGGAGGWNQFGPVISDAAPSYLDAAGAVADFFDGADATRYSPPFDQAVIRIVEDDGWIDNVHVAPTVMRLQVRGTRTAGARLELNSPSEKAAQMLSGEEVVEFPIPGGIPSGASAILSQSGRLLDQRRLGPPWGSYGVTFEPPPLSDRVEIIVAGGEGPEAEFKVRLPATDGERKKLAATVAAFANGGGGTIVYGVENDTLTAIGVDVTQESLDSLQRVIRNRLEPQPEVTIEKVATRGVTVIAVTVSQGSATPYGINPDAIEIYVRRGANTVRAHREEVVALAAPPANEPYARFRPVR